MNLSRLTITLVIFKHFGFAAQHEIAVELFGTLGFADKASGMLV